MNQLFYKVWKNLVLKTILLDNVRLLNKNLKCTFYNREDLINYKEKSFIKEIHYHGKQILLKGDLPENNGIFKIVHIVIDQEVLNSFIPEGVEILYYQNGFLNDICSPHDILKSLPSTLKEIHDLPMTNVSPKLKSISINLKTITFHRGCSFNQTIPTANLFKNLTTLKFNNHWNNGGKKLKVGDLPNGLTNLNLGNYMVTLTADTIPSTITILKLKCVGKIKFSLPNSILKLSIKQKDIQENLIITSNTIPNSVVKLKIQSKNLEILSNSLPNSIKKLKINKTRMGNVKLSNELFPKNLEKLIIDVENRSTFSIGSIPKTLTSLILFARLQSNDIQSTISNGLLKDCKNLTYLEIDLNFTNSITFGSLPDSIITLKLSNYNKPIEQGCLPKSLTFLKFLNIFNQPIKKLSLPYGLKTIYFGCDYNQPIDQLILPESLEKLHFYRYGHFNQPFFQSTPFPKSLTHLEFGICFNCPLNNDQFPNKNITIILNGDKKINLESKLNTIKNLKFYNNK